MRILFIAACVLPQTTALVGIRPSPATRRSAAASDAPSPATRRSAASEDAAEAATSIAAAATAANKNDDDAKIKAIAGPALLGTLADPLLSVVDTAWVSRLGTTALGAVAASSEIFTLVIAVSLALREAASSTIARLTAQGRWREAEAHGAKTLLTAFGVGALLTLLLVGPGGPGAVGLLGCPRGSPLHADALTYARIRALALPCAVAQFAAEGVCRGLGDTKPPLRAALLAGLMNVVLDPVLMFRCGWNVAGAAAATAISQACACALLLVELNGKRGNRAPSSTVDVPSTKEQNLLGTSLALLLRSTSQLGTWVFVASQVSRRLGARAIAAHGVVLKVWLLFVLAAEAPAVAGQVISAGYLATGRRARAARVVKRLGKATVTIGLITAAALAAAAGPISYAFFPTDTAAAKSTKTIFRWAALSVPLVWPNALCEAVLLGAGRYRYLAGATLVNALVATFATVALLTARPLVTSAWACLCGFFVLRFAVSAGGAARELLPASRAGGLRYRSSSSR